MMAPPEPHSLMDAIQAGAAVVTVGAGFAYIAYQRSAESGAAGRAAAHLARHSIDFVTDRLNALVDPDLPIEFALRGTRATEMIEVFRELEISRLPPEMIEAVAVIRSTVFAINSRIDEVLTDDKDRRTERRNRLYSAGRTLTTARAELDTLRKRFKPWDQGKFKPAKLSPRITAFLGDAHAASKCNDAESLPPAHIGSPNLGQTDPSTDG